MSIGELNYWARKMWGAVMSSVWFMIPRVNAVIGLMVE